MTHDLDHLMREWIAENGPMPVSLFMDLALSHPEMGYYKQRSPFGRQGDFTTAPEISQLFGECIAIWVARQWEQMGKPAQWVLMEGGPGRGTLMVDMLHTLGQLNKKQLPGLTKGLSAVLVEYSPALKKVQQEALADSAVPVRWQSDFALPGEPVVVVANELLDALPVDQYIYEDGAWRMRVVVAMEGVLRFSTGTAKQPPHAPDNPVEGDIYEYSPASHTLMQQLADHMADHKASALLIDYGHAHLGWGDSLQAVKDHSYSPILEHIGHSDISAHVDFGRLAATAERSGAVTYGAVSQSYFLHNLGILPRVEALANAQKKKAEELIRGYDRLTHHEGMGQLFKVLCIQSPHLPVPEGFGEQ